MHNNKKENRLFSEKLNIQGCLMKVVEYKSTKYIVVEFQDEHQTRVSSQWQYFEKGNILNPYCPSVFSVGIVGNKYERNKNGQHTKEYNTWVHMLERCFSERYKKEESTYKDVTCCQEWLLYENFYEWLHSQENFNEWLSNDGWHLDKDILVKGNKVYSPNVCCLVPPRINCLFVKNNIRRGNLPIGVSYHKFSNSYNASLNYDSKVKSKYFPTVNEAFIYYKSEKENIIKQVAQEEYSQGNITKECYEAMIAYEVEIDD